MKPRFPMFSILLIILCLVAIVYIFTKQGPSKEQESQKMIEETGPVSEKIFINPTPTPELEQTPSEQRESFIETPTPQPSPPPLDDSDSYILNSLNDIPSGVELIGMLTQEEIARKIVRAIYGLSEGRIVRQYRPIDSPKKSLVVTKIGQQTPDTKEEIYRLSRENSSRYTHYISIFSKINTDLGLKLYQFYLPTLEEAYLELGTNQGSFHSTFIKAIDVLLDSPSFDKAILLTRPTVMYKFKDSELEKLPSAHKLMLRMGQENSEALKLELRKLRKKLTNE